MPKDDRLENLGDWVAERLQILESRIARLEQILDERKLEKCDDVNYSGLKAGACPWRHAENPTCPRQ